MCTTTTHWATHISSECSVGGSGQCDGFCVDHQDECTCSCHSDWTDLPGKVSEVRDWHDNEYNVVASFEEPYGREEEAKELAFAEADKRNDKPVDGSVYRALQGQGRVVVVLDF